MVDHIFVKYMQLGGGKSLGEPKQPEQVVISRSGLEGYYRDFEKGSIYWTAQTGAHLITNEILAHWRNIEAQDSKLGYPIGDTIEDHESTFHNQFQGGTIYYLRSEGRCKVHLLSNSSTVFRRRLIITAITVALFFCLETFFNMSNCTTKVGIAMATGSCNVWGAGVLPTFLALLTSIAAGFLIRFVWPKDEH